MLERWEQADPWSSAAGLPCPPAGRAVEGSIIYYLLSPAGLFLGMSRMMKVEDPDPPPSHWREPH